MSDAKPVKQNSTRIIIIVSITLLVVLSGIYAGGLFLIPNIIVSNYKSKNCDLVLTLNDLYASIYPANLANKSMDESVSECAIYSLALDAETQKNWKASHDSYKIYEKTFPNGVFATDAHEYGAFSLMALAKEQASQKKYDEAIGSLNGILDAYKDPDVMSQASSLVVDVYTNWGADLRNTNDFEKSENTLRIFKNWAEQANKSAEIKSAKHELAKTYLAWGLAIQSEKKFEDAKIKLDLAASTDPEPTSVDGPAVQARVAQANLYAQWGDTLIAQNDFANGIEHYKTAATLLDQPTLKDAIVNGYIKWAMSFIDTEDFLGALKKLDEAGGNATTDTAKKSIVDAQTDIYLAFSMSTGDQAKKVMDDVIRTVCVDHKRPDMLIFGLDKTHILAGAYGPDIEIKLPDSVAATTPGTMHYLACIEQESNIVAKTTMNNYGPTPATLVREQYTWHITLWKLDTLGPTQSAVTQEFDLLGAVPPPFPSARNTPHDEWMDILFGGSYQHFRGAPPSMDDLAKQLLLVMK